MESQYYSTGAPGGKKTKFRFDLVLVALVVGGLLGAILFKFTSRPAVQADARPVTPAGDLGADEKSMVELFKRTSPSVVYITTLTQRMNVWTRDVTEIPAGTGSGFIWDDAGHIVTNFHVIKGASGAKVTLNDHTAFDAELVGASPNFDLAVLRIKAPKEKLLKLPYVGSSQGLLVGQKVFAIGNPFGLDQTLTTGIISAIGRSIKGVSGQPIDDVIQTDAAINPGNSGGPLLDSSGRLIGVNTAIYSPSGASAGIGFAVPVDTVQRIVPQLINTGKVARPEFGVVADERLSRAITSRLGVQGLMVMGVDEGSPAAAAGLKPTVRSGNGIVPGDIIQKLDGKDVTSMDAINALLERRKTGDTIKLMVLREGETREINVKL